jgi:hypothetical protein
MNTTDMVRAEVESTAWFGWLCLVAILAGDDSLENTHISFALRTGKRQIIHQLRQPSAWN